MDLSGSLVPGWALALLALTLWLPAALASLDGLRRTMRHRGQVGWALGWSASRGLPLASALLLLYLLALIGVVTRPTFPFDPSGFAIGPGEVLVMVLLAGVAAAGYRVLRGWRVPAGLREDAAGAGLGAISALAVLVAWLANPFLALILAPAAHVWLLDARHRPLPWPAVAAGAALSLLPFAAAVADLAGRLGMGPPPHGSSSDRRRRPDRVRSDGRAVRLGRVPYRDHRPRRQAPRLHAGSATLPPPLSNRSRHPSSTIRMRAIPILWTHLLSRPSGALTIGERNMKTVTGDRPDRPSASRIETMTRLKQQIARQAYQVDAQAVAREILFKLRMINSAAGR